MSGLGDLASWALRGVGGGGGGDQNGDGGEEQEQGQETNMEALSPQEMRAQRLARMEAQQQKAAQEQAAAADSDEPKPMDIDEKPAASPKAKKDSPVKMDVDGDDKKKKSSSLKSSSPPQSSPQKEHKKKKAKESHSSPADPARKAQKKAEFLLKKVLSISLVGTSTTSDSSCVVIDIDDTAVTVQNIAEILATRLALSANAPELRTMPAQKALIPYLAQCHRRASEEVKAMKQQQSSSSSKSSSSSPDLLEILEEIKRQVVSYASSCLSVPELFELGRDAPTQLSKCFTAAVTDPATSITFGVTGSASSFYYLLCEELLSSDEEAFERVIGEITNYLTKQLVRTDSVLDAGDGTDGSALVLVTALTSVCQHKKAAEIVTQLPNFLLPAEGSSEAKEVVDNSAQQQTGNDIMARLLAMRNQNYLKRSGPALDKGTVLGLCLRPGIPKLNPAFSSTRMSQNAVEQTSNSQRQQLRVHQESCNQLVMALIKAGPDARSKVCVPIAID